MPERRKHVVASLFVSACLLVLLIVTLAVGPAQADDRDACWIEYEPGQLKNFAYFYGLDRGNRSRVVTYKFHYQSNLNVYYEDVPEAKKWIRHVIRQLKGCNG